jgi:transcriptional regulator with GAF, ATPase, and Fis domain
VLARVNDPRRQLYEATILSEIGGVARTPVRLEETVTSVLGLIGRVVDFALGAVAFIDGDEMETFFLLRHPAAGTAVEAIRARLAEAVLRHRPGAALREVRTRVLAPADAGGRTAGPEGLDAFRIFPVIAGQTVVAALALAGRALARIPPETEALLAQATNQAHIVENARLIGACATSRSATGSRAVQPSLRDGDAPTSSARGPLRLRPLRAAHGHRPLKRSTTSTATRPAT